MATFSQLNGASRQRWHERSTRAQQRYGITHADWIVLCDAEHVLNTWDAMEANGEIQRDEPTDQWPLGRPRRFVEMQDGTLRDLGYTPDRAAGAMRRAKQVLVGHPDLMIYWQGDCRGASVYIYSRSECLERGGDIESLYSTMGTACFY